MPVSGLVITLSDDSAAAHAAVAHIEHCPHLTSRQPVSRRVAAVLDTHDKRQDKDVWQWLESLEGVAHVDVVFVHFDDDGPIRSDGTARLERQVTP